MSSVGYAPFDGDGRKKVKPTIRLPHTYPIEVTNGQARRTIDAFNHSGHTNHSGNGGTLWVILEWAQRNKVAYNLNAFPGMGYTVSRTGVVT